MTIHVQKRLSLKDEFGRLGELWDCIDRGRFVGRLGLVPAVVLMCYFATPAGILLIPCLLVGDFLVPWGCGLLADHWFHGSVVPQMWATIVLVLLVDAAMTGWLLVLAR